LNNDDEVYQSLNRQQEEAMKRKKQAVEIEDYEAAHMYKLQVQALEKQIEASSNSKQAQEKKRLAAEQKRKEIEAEITSISETKKKAVEEEDYTFAQQCKLKLGELQQQLVQVNGLLKSLISATVPEVPATNLKSTSIEPTVQVKMDLIQATVSGKLAQVKELIEHGQDVNYVDSKTGDTALHVASAIGNESISKYLVDNGADANIKNKLGRTPLRILMEKRALNSPEFQPRFETIISYILEFAGGDLNIPDNEGNNAFDLADPSYQLELQEILDELRVKYKS